MKKLFYIILVIVILLVISRFVKNEAPAPVEPDVVVEETVEEIANAPISDAEIAEPANPDALGDGEVMRLNRKKLKKPIRPKPLMKTKPSSKSNKA